MQTKFKHRCYLIPFRDYILSLFFHREIGHAVHTNQSFVNNRLLFDVKTLETCNRTGFID